MEVVWWLGWFGWRGGRQRRGQPVRSCSSSTALVRPQYYLYDRDVRGPKRNDRAAPHRRRDCPALLSACLLHFPERFITHTCARDRAKPHTSTHTRVSVCTHKAFTVAAMPCSSDLPGDVKEVYQYMADGTRQNKPQCRAKAGERHHAGARGREAHGEAGRAVATHSTATSLRERVPAAAAGAALMPSKLDAFTRSHTKINSERLSLVLRAHHTVCGLTRPHTATHTAQLRCATHTHTRARTAESGRGHGLGLLGASAVDIDAAPAPMASGLS